jgi:hypothetical protein
MAWDGTFQGQDESSKRQIDQSGILRYSQVQNYWRITIFTLRVTLTTPKTDFFAQGTQTIEFHPSKR